MAAKTLVFAVLLAVLGVLLGGSIAQFHYDIQGYVLVALALLLLVPFLLIPRVSRGEGFGFVKFLLVAFFVKAGVSLFRLYWGFGWKEGAIDAARYHRAGQGLAESIRHLDFSWIADYFEPGTEFIEIVTGFVYSVIGPTLPGGFLLFAFLAFVGAIFYYKAFRIAFPTGNKKLYAGLAFLYPSWVYWPSSIGKDASLALLIGLFAYGIALVFRKVHWKGWLLLALALVGVAMIRPHVSAMLALALAFPLVFALPLRTGALTPIVRALVTAVAILVCWVTITQAAAFLQFEEISFGQALQTYELFQEQALRGGAAFAPLSIMHPLGVPMAIVTILFRPFPWEAHSFAALILSFEGLLLIVLCLWRWRRIARAILSIRSDPYALFIVAYAILFILVFTSMGNFSLVGRQRLMLLPLFFMLLAYPVEGAQVRKSPYPSSAPSSGRLALVQ